MNFALRALELKDIPFCSVSDFRAGEYVIRLVSNQSCHRGLLTVPDPRFSERAPRTTASKQEAAGETGMTPSRRQNVGRDVEIHIQ